MHVLAVAADAATGGVARASLIPRTLLEPPHANRIATRHLGGAIR